MHEYEPIRIRPLTLRGVFGITGKVFGRRLGALIGYNCLYLVVLLLIVGIAMLPMLQPLFSLPDYQTSNAEALRIVGGSLMTVMLALLGSLLLSLLIQPIYCGTLYGELSARIYGSASSVGLMLRRSKFSLKRFFTTTLCYLLAAFAIAFVLNIFVSIFTAFATLFATLRSIPSLLNGGVFHAGAGLIVPLVLVFLLVFVAELAGTSFLLFVYPVAVNEPHKELRRRQTQFPACVEAFRPRVRLPAHPLRHRACLRTDLRRLHVFRDNAFRRSGHCADLPRRAALPCYAALSEPLRGRACNGAVFRYPYPDGRHCLAR